MTGRQKRFTLSAEVIDAIDLVRDRTAESRQNFVLAAVVAELEKRGEKIHPPMTQCVVCGTPILRSRKTRLYCSVKCRNRAYRKQHNLTVKTFKAMQQRIEELEQL